MNPLSVSRAVGLLLLTLVVIPAGPSTAATYVYEFDKDTGSFDGTDGWDSAYCADPWATNVNGGVVPLTDDGCALAPCDQNYNCGYEFGYWSPCSNSDPYDNHIQVGSPNWQNYVFTAKFKNHDDDTFGFAFRYKNSGQFYLLYFSRDQVPNHQVACPAAYVGSRLLRIKNSKAVVLASSEVTYQQSVVHQVRITVAGNHIKAEFDADGSGGYSPEETLFELDDAAGLNKGKVGLYAFENGLAGLECAPGGCWFDDVVVDVSKTAQDACQGISYEGVCEGNTLKYCYQDQLVAQQCPGCCKWSPGQQFFNCFPDNQCSNSCENECANGAAGCSDELTHAYSCGQADEDSCTEIVFQDCADSGFCDPATGQCVPVGCQPNCGIAQCGDDGCGGSCGECPAGFACVNYQCVQDCVPFCNGKMCGPDGCGGVCGFCQPNHQCNIGVCECIPACLNIQCGDDGCGGQCGTCGEGYSCEAGFCKEGPCIPQCADKECGDDECGGSCGQCPVDFFCQDGACLEAVCVPQCQGKLCGPDGCGGGCGECQFGELCLDGVCRCTPDCTGKVCGSDGCGGTCGDCPAPLVCSAAQCVEAEECTSHAHLQCFGDDLYWFDSCKQKEEMAQECELGCDVDHCFGQAQPDIVVQEVLTKEDVASDVGTIDTGGRPIDDDTVVESPDMGITTLGGKKSGGCSSTGAGGGGPPMVAFALLLLLLGATVRRLRTSRS